MDAVSPIAKNWQAHLKRKSALWEKISAVTTSFQANGSNLIPQVAAALEAKSGEMDQLRALNAELSRTLQTQRAENTKAQQKLEERHKNVAARAKALESEVEKEKHKRAEIKVWHLARDLASVLACTL